MINYAIKDLQYSESAALRRIQSARLLADIPEIENKINDGSLSLSNLQKASNFFKQENIQDIGGKLEVIEKLEGKTAREAEKTLFELGTTPVLPPESVKPVSASFTQVKVNVSDETYNLMTKARSILGEFSFGDSYMSKVACEAIENINRKKYKLTSKGRNTETSGRVPTASQQRELYERGEGVCEKCGSLFKVQKDHRHPYSLGGKTETSNLRLLCFHCNQRERIKAKL